jgi:hypothetical protein
VARTPCGFGSFGGVPQPQLCGSPSRFLRGGILPVSDRRIAPFSPNALNSPGTTGHPPPGSFWSLSGGHQTVNSTFPQSFRPSLNISVAIRCGALSSAGRTLSLVSSSMQSGRAAITLRRQPALTLQGCEPGSPRRRSSHVTKVSWTIIEKEPTGAAPGMSAVSWPSRAALWGVAWGNASSRYRSSP